MKTNISALMSIISEEEKNFNTLLVMTKGHLFSTTIEELDGKVTVIEDYKTDFKNELEVLESLNNKISTLKKVLFEKNNTFKLNDGRTIQQAISDNNYLRKLKSFYESITLYNSSKRRVTEVNNSYFESKTLNCNIDEIKSKLKLIDEKIQQTDFEISVLNSKEFEIEF